MHDTTEHLKLEIEEQTKASGTTQAVSALLAMSSGPDSAATNWGSVTIETYPRERWKRDDS
jgi:hypothetical protein